MRASDPDHIYNWRRIDASLTTSGQPAEDDLAKLRALGVSHIVNLGPHSHDKALPDEAASVAALGMDYIYIPVDFGCPTEADYALFAETMERLAGRMVHVHCIANMRVSAFLYRWRRDVLGFDDGEARAEMESIWRPGGVWAALIGDDSAVNRSHELRGSHY